MGTSGYQWVPVYQVYQVYQEYQEDQDQISGATYISDVVFLTGLTQLCFRCNWNLDKLYESGIWSNQQQGWKVTSHDISRDFSRSRILINVWLKGDISRPPTPLKYAGQQRMREARGENYELTQPLVFLIRKYFDDETNTWTKPFWLPLHPLLCFWQKS